MPASGTKRKAATGARQPVGKRSKRSKRDLVAVADSMQLSPSDGLSYLEKLPDELLILIVEQSSEPVEHSAKPVHLDVNQYYYYAKPVRSASACYNLALTSKRLNRVATDCLYSHYDTLSGCPVKFLRTLIAYPELAAKVKTLIWITDYQYLPQRLTRKDRDSICDSLERLGVLSGPLERLHAGRAVESAESTADILKFLLPHTTNLQKLSTNEIWKESPSNSVGTPPCLESYLSILLEAGHSRRLGNSSTFEHLQDLRIDASYGPLETIYVLFNLPSLKTLCLRRVDDWDGSILHPRTSSSSITQLEIYDGFLLSENLAILIRSCRELKQLRVTLYEDCDTETPIIFKYSQIACALRSHKQTLEEIVLVDESGRFSPPDDSKLDSFHDFPKLRVLDVPFDNLPRMSAETADLVAANEGLGWLSRCLPVSLRNLSLSMFEETTHTTKWQNHALSKYSNVVKQTHPHLSSIFIRINTMDAMFPSQYSEAKWRFRLSNISFNMRVRSFDAWHLEFIEDEPEDPDYLHDELCRLPQLHHLLPKTMAVKIKCSIGFICNPDLQL